MSQEEADKIIRRMRALAEGGPGGCKTNEECNAVCQNPTPEFVEECINFAVKTGGMTPEGAQQMLENTRMMQEGPPPAPEGIQPLEGMPPEGMPSEGMPLESVPPEGMIGPSPEEIMGPSPQEMGPPMLPPEEVAPPLQEITPESPQSFFELLKNFLASLISF